MPERWFILDVYFAGDDSSLISDALLELGGSAVEEHAAYLRTYLPATHGRAELERRASSAIRSVAPDARLEWSEIEDQDWSSEWRRGLRPRRVGDRIIVTPSWVEPEAQPGDIVLTIDPEMAFGTGEHATTRSCLRLLQHAVHTGDRVLDVGTGSAILAIAAAHLGAATVLGAESDPDAIENARDNVARNGVQQRVQIELAFVDDAYLDRISGSCDVIAANVLSGVLTPLLPAFHRTLRPGGRLILSGILEEEADAMIASARAAGFALRIEDLENEWWSALFAVAEEQLA